MFRRSTKTEPQVRAEFGTRAVASKPNRVEYFPQQEAKPSKQALASRGMHKKASKQEIISLVNLPERIALEYKEDPVYFRVGTVKTLNQQEREQDYEILQRDNPEEEDHHFVNYYDQPSVEEVVGFEGFDALSDEENHDISGFEDCFIDPNSFYKNAFVVERLKNGIASRSNEEAEISVMSISDLAVEKFLTGGGYSNQDMAAKLKKVLPKTTANATQGNYSDIWFQDFNEVLQDPENQGPAQHNIRFGEHVIKNWEDFEWVQKRYRYKDQMIPFTQAERERVIAYQKPKEKVLLDPGVHGTLEQLNVLLKKLQKRHIKKEEFLAKLSKLHVRNLLTTGFVRVFVQQDHGVLLRGPPIEQDDPI